MKNRIESWIEDMTLDEKLAQLGSVWSYEVMAQNQFSEEKANVLFANGIGQITRIGGATNLDKAGAAKLANRIQRHLLERTRHPIPAIVHEESCCGYMARGATCFPQTIGVASAWDVDLAQDIGAVIQRQMRRSGAHQALAPLLDVTRDPRWGRTEETFGEDPYLTSQMGMAYVRGLQGESLAEGVLATGKHFVGYGASIGGMNWAPVHISPRELREVYLLPFEAAIREANLGAIMPGYHEQDGIPCHGSKALLQDILREEWGFDGLVVSDYFGVNNLFEYHHVAANPKEAARLAVACGVDVELPSRDVYGEALRQAVLEGLVRMDDIHTLVRRVLQTKERLGLFEHPYVHEDACEVLETVMDRDLAYKAAQKSIVLLKNEHGILPLAKTRGSIAVIGPNADSIRNLVGDYAYPCHIEALLEMRDGENVFHTAMPDALEGVSHFVSMKTIVEAIRDRVGPATHITYEMGCDIQGDDPSPIESAVTAAAAADVAIVVVGDKAGLTDDCTSGEARDRASLGLPGLQQRLVESVVATGTPTVVVFVSGRPLSVPWIAKHVPAVIQAWLPGEEGAAAIADVLFGDYNPAGRLPITVARSVGQVPIYYGHKPSGGRSHWKGPYVDESNLPLFAFGHGLSYTQFAYGNLAMSRTSIPIHGVIEIECTVENVGECAGDEVVQLYIRDPEASVTRPVLELRGFRRVHLDKGEAKRVTFHLSAHQTGFYNEDMEFVVEPGTIEVGIGAASDDIRLRGCFEISGDVTDVADRKVFTTPVDVQTLV